MGIFCVSIHRAPCNHGFSLLQARFFPAEAISRFGAAPLEGVRVCEGELGLVLTPIYYSKTGVEAPTKVANSPRNPGTTPSNKLGLIHMESTLVGFRLSQTQTAGRAGSSTGNCRTATKNKESCRIVSSGFSPKSLVLRYVCDCLRSCFRGFHHVAVSSPRSFLL